MLCLLLAKVCLHSFIGGDRNFFTVEAQMPLMRDLKRLREQQANALSRNATPRDSEALEMFEEKNEHSDEDNDDTMAEAAIALKAHE